MQVSQGKPREWLELSIQTEEAMSRKERQELKDKTGLKGCCQQKTFYK